MPSITNHRRKTTASPPAPDRIPSQPPPARDEAAEVGLRLALEASDSVAFELDLNGGPHRTNSPLGATLTHLEFVRLIHPNDRFKLSLDYLRRIEPGRIHHDRIHLTLADGTSQHYTARFRLLTDIHGHPTTIVGVATPTPPPTRSTPPGRGAADPRDLPISSVALQAAQLAQALRSNQIIAHYQPLVNLADQKVMGVEALARWAHPTRGVVSPDEFIPLAERTNLIYDLGRQILTQAVGQVAAWNNRRRDHDLEPLTCSVNVSTLQLADPAFAASVKAALAEHDLDPKLLWLEITETLPIPEYPTIHAVLADLRSAGAGIVLDDVGTGYSGLRHISQLPITGIKLARHYIRDLETPTSPSAAIAASVASLSQRLGIHTIAEGVEQTHQAEKLREMGWHIGQGHLWSQAQAAKAFGPYGPGS